MQKKTGTKFGKVRPFFFESVHAYSWWALRNHLLSALLSVRLHVWACEPYIVHYNNSMVHRAALYLTCGLEVKGHMDQGERLHMG